MELFHAQLAVLCPVQLQAHAFKQLAGDLPVEFVVLCQQDPPSGEVHSLLGGVGYGGQVGLVGILPQAVVEGGLK